MTGFDQPESVYDWAKRKGIAQRCAKHRTYFDPHLGCAQCRKQELKEARVKVERTVNRLFETVIWPNERGKG